MIQTSMKSSIPRKFLNRMQARLTWLRLIGC